MTSSNGRNGGLIQRPETRREVLARLMAHAVESFNNLLQNRLYQQIDRMVSAEVIACIICVAQELKNQNMSEHAINIAHNRHVYAQVLRCIDIINEMYPRGYIHMSAEANPPDQEILQSIAEAETDPNAVPPVHVNSIGRGGRTTGRRPGTHGAKVIVGRNGKVHVSGSSQRMGIKEVEAFQARPPKNHVIRFKKKP